MAGKNNPADKYSDKTFGQLESQISRMYREAYKDVSKKMADFTRRHKAKDKAMLRDLKRGKITQEKYNTWMRGQVFIGQQWQNTKDSINATIKNVMNEAASLTHTRSLDVFVDNANYTAYQIEKDHGFSGGVNFTVYDRKTVSRLILEDPELLPRKRDVDGKKLEAWNTKVIANAVSQAIIQGESIDQLSERIARDTSIQAGRSSLLYARTAMTAAQNAGRVERMKEAEEMGIKIQKQWIATLDGRTRHTHAAQDGDVVDLDEEFGNGLMYPGDPDGDPKETYNCRCTLAYHYPEYSDFSKMDRIAYIEEGDPDYDPDDPHRQTKTVTNMTYTQWKDSKQDRTKTGGNGSQDFEWNNDNSGGFELAETNTKSIVSKNMGWYDELYTSKGHDSKEINVITSYQNSSQAINEQLRSGTLKPSTKTKVNTLTRVLDTSRVDSPFVAHRSSDGKLLGIDGEVSVEKLRSMVGKVVTDNGFTSTALSSKTGYDRGSAQYIQKTGGIKPEELVQYHIKTPAGDGIGGLVLGPKWGDRYVGVPEFIFNRGSQFKIVGVYEKDGVVHCNMEYVGNIRKSTEAIEEKVVKKPSKTEEQLAKEKREKNIASILKSHTVDQLTNVQKQEFVEMLNGMHDGDVELYSHMVKFHKDNQYKDKGTGWYAPFEKRVRMDIDSNGWEKKMGRTESTGAWKTKFHEELHQLDHLLGMARGGSAFSDASRCEGSQWNPPTPMGIRLRKATENDVMSLWRKAIDKYNSDLSLTGSRAIKYITDVSKPIPRDAKFALMNHLEDMTKRYYKPGMDNVEKFRSSQKVRAMMSPLTDAIGLMTGGRVDLHAEGFWGHDASYDKQMGINGMTSEVWAELGSHLMRNDTEVLTFLQEIMPESSTVYREELDEALKFIRDNPGLLKYPKH